MAASDDALAGSGLRALAPAASTVGRAAPPSSAPSPPRSTCRSVATPRCCRSSRLTACACRPRWPSPRRSARRLGRPAGRRGRRRVAARCGCPASTIRAVRTWRPHAVPRPPRSGPGACRRHPSAPLDLALARRRPHADRRRCWRVDPVHPSPRARRHARGRGPGLTPSGDDVALRRPARPAPARARLLLPGRLCGRGARPPRATTSLSGRPAHRGRRRGMPRAPVVAPRRRPAVAGDPGRRGAAELAAPCGRHRPHLGRRPARRARRVPSTRSPD